MGVEHYLQSWGEEKTKLCGIGGKSLSSGADFESWIQPAIVLGFLIANDRVHYSWFKQEEMYYRMLASSQNFWRAGGVRPDESMGEFSVKTPLSHHSVPMAFRDGWQRLCHCCPQRTGCLCHCPGHGSVLPPGGLLLNPGVT